MKKFTLIELLVVMAIIGILSTLLMPSLRKARQKVKTAVCLGQNKQMVYSWQIRMDDYDGKFFDYLEDSHLWTGHLKDYIIEDALLICPETSVVEESSSYIFGTAKRPGEMAEETLNHLGIWRPMPITAAFFHTPTYLTILLILATMLLIKIRRRSHHQTKRLS